MYGLIPTSCLLVCGLLISFPLLCVSQCSPVDTNWGSYFYDLPPVPYMGVNTEGSLCNDGNICFGPRFGGGARLADGNYGDSPLNLTNLNAHAWNKTVTISPGFINIPSPITGINLYFYYVPSEGIGLPIDITVGSGVEFAVEGNLDLGQTDSDRVNITLIPNSLLIPSDGELPIRFTLAANDPVDWILLTEVELCIASAIFPEPPDITFSTDTVTAVTPSSVTSSIVLRCSVDIDGRFDWSWTGNAQQPLSNVVTTDIGRTSTVELTQVSSEDSGTYQCEATHTYGSNPPSNTTVISLVLEGNLDTESNVVESADPTVVLSCELHGYLRNEVPTIQWFRGSQLLTNNPLYTVATRPGNRLIQNGASQPIASLVSSLTIQVVNNSEAAGTYSCDSRQLANSIVQMIELRIGSSGPTSGSTPVPVEELPIGPIVGGIVAIIVLLIVVIIIVIVIIVVMKRKRMYHDSAYVEDYGSKDSLYQEICKPIPPPLPPRYPSQSDIDPYAVTPNGVSSRQIELVNLNDNRNSSPESNLHSPLKPIKNEPNFLQDNPLYASTDHINDLPPTPRRRTVGSVDSLNSMTESMLNIYAVPFKVAPPPIPARLSTSEDSFDGVYSEALSPSMMTERRYSTPPCTFTEESCPASSVYAEPEPLLRSEGPVEIAPRQVNDVRSLGVGQFGQVMLAETVGLSLKDLRLSENNNDRNIAVQVAVKRLKPDADAGIKEAFEKEIKFMSRLNHKNVVRLLGICPYGTPFIVMEYMENGDLNQYLQKHQSNDETLSPDTLLYIAVQVSYGMMYLATLKFIHRDLATRNCLVGSNYEVKIADFGMSRSLYTSYYYRIRGRAMLPIRWMANECFYGRFSEKTDIWAFGILMWEIYTFGSLQPYDDMSDQEVIDDAIRGPDRLLLERPERCPPEVYEVMLKCWIDDVDERATFEQVYTYLQRIYEHTEL